MSYQHYDHGGSYGSGGGIPQYSSTDRGYYPQQPQRAAKPMLPSQERRGMSPSYQQAAPNARGPPPVRPLRPAERQLQREQHQYAQSMPLPPHPAGQEYQENLYDGSAYGEPEYGESMAADAWPLPSPPKNSGFLDQGRSSGDRQRRGPPQRPQRPDYQPPVDPRQPRVAPAQEQYRQPHPQHRQQQQQHYPPSHHGTGQWTGDGYASPSTLQALPQHHPQPPQQYLQANKRPPLGPPPSARRGPASYYPQVAPVHPIAEETDSMRGSIRSAAHTMGGGHDSMRSYASSNAMPIGVPDYYLEQNSNASSVPSPPGAGRHAEIATPNEEFDESPIDRDMSPMIERGGSAMEEDESREPSPEPQAALVRQASLGRKSKPTLTTVKSGDRMRQASLGDGRVALPSQQQKNVKPVPNVQQALEKEAGFAKETAGSISPRSSFSDDEPHRDTRNSQLRDKEMEADGMAAVAAVPKPIHAPNRASKSKDNLSQRSDPLASGNALLDPTPPASDSDEKSFRAMTRKQDMDDMPTRSQILAGLSKGGALPATDAQAVSGAGLAELRADKRRPPRLNVDAVRDAEARGSLTSLPDLIKRATRLASNLDRGKTASRLGMNWFEGANDDENRASAVGKRASEGGSLSDMLNSFPRPEHGTPELAGAKDREGNRWARSQLTSSSSSGQELRSRRRCCGIPLWLFLVILILLILLVAAAIIVPMVLVVVPRQNSASQGAGGTTTAAALNQCRSTLPCAHSGASVLTSGGQCGCICVNGYTGTQCGTTNQAGCTSIDVGETSNATVGDQLPKLLQSAAANWGVPLNASVLLGLFSNENLGCSGENGLVDLNGTSSKNGRRRRAAPTPTSLPLPLGKRQNTPNTAMTNGIVFETGSPTATSATSATTAAATTPISSASPSASASSSNSKLEKQQTFAQITILFVLQATGQLGNAVSAQTELSNFFAREGASSNTTVTLGQGSGWWCDLTGFRVMEGNGTVVGGKGGP